jgi:phosphatidate cytidylyltransferase
VVVLMAVGYLFPPFWSAFFGFAFTVALYLISSVRDNDPNAKWVAMGIPYMGGCGLALLALRAMPGWGEVLVFYLLAVVWGTDIGAYLFGCLIRGPKLAPAISPKKTWAGFFGGLITATLVGYAAAAALGARYPSAAIILSPLLSGVSQAGDLFESYFKRRSGVKESGDLIPGHGGVLDRIDGLVFAGAFLFLFEATLGTSILWW